MNSKSEAKFLRPIDYDDFHFRINYKEEEMINQNDNFVQLLIDQWDQKKKNFHFIKIFTFYNYNYDNN